MKSINKINGQLASNATIQMYYNLSDDRRNVWQNRSFNFLFGARKSQQSVLGTFIYGQCMDEFSRITKLPRHYDYEATTKRVNYELYCNGKTLHFDIVCHVDINGVNLRIYSTNFKPLENFHSHLVRSNETWAQFDLYDYFENRILPKYFYAPGLFRNIQIVFNLEKKEVAGRYKNMLEVNKRPYEVDVQKAMKQVIKSRFNILLTDYINDTTFSRLMKTLEYQKKRCNAVKTPSMFDIYEYCSSQADTDEGMESAFSEYMEDYKGAMLI